MFANKYLQRRVGPTDSRACFICHRPTTSVMVNENPSADFFYACDAHLTDPGFAKYDAEYEQAEKLRQQKHAEVDRLKAEWERVQKKKTDKKTDDKSTDDQSKKDSKDANPVAPPADISPTGKPKYELNKGVYNLRLGAKRRAAQERKTKAMLGNPGVFPSVPTHKPT